MSKFDLEILEDKNTGRKDPIFTPFQICILASVFFIIFGLIASLIDPS
jgi:hypothetical protein